VRQADLFGDTPVRRPRRVMMHATDTGQPPYSMPHWRTDKGGHFECQRCGHVHGWQFNMTESEIWRGLPCPTCNKGANQ